MSSLVLKKRHSVNRANPRPTKVFSTMWFTKGVVITYGIFCNAPHAYELAPVVSHGPPLTCDTNQVPTYQVRYMMSQQ